MKNVCNHNQEEGAGGSRENLIICSHFPIRSVIVELSPKLDCIRLLSCSTFTCRIPSSISIDLLKCSSLAPKYSHYSSNSSSLFRASLSYPSTFFKSDETFSQFNYAFLISPSVSLRRMVFCWMSSSFSLFKLLRSSS